MPLRMMSKTVDEHVCEGRKKPMLWRPAEVIALQNPSIADSVRSSAPSVAAYCSECLELWIVPIKG